MVLWVSGQGRQVLPVQHRCNASARQRCLTSPGMLTELLRGQQGYSKSSREGPPVAKPEHLNPEPLMLCWHRCLPANRCMAKAAQPVLQLPTKAAGAASRSTNEQSGQQKGRRQHCSCLLGLLALLLIGPNTEKHGRQIQRCPRSSGLPAVLLLGQENAQSKHQRVTRLELSLLTRAAGVAVGGSACQCCRASMACL